MLKKKKNGLRSKHMIYSKGIEYFILWDAVFIEFFVVISITGFLLQHSSSVTF